MEQKYEQRIFDMHCIQLWYCSRDRENVENRRTPEQNSQDKERPRNIVNNHEQCWCWFLKHKEGSSSWRCFSAWCIDQQWFSACCVEATVFSSPVHWTATVFSSPVHGTVGPCVAWTVIVRILGRHVHKKRTLRLSWRTPTAIPHGGLRNPGWVTRNIGLAKIERQHSRFRRMDGQVKDLCLFKASRWIHHDL